MSERFQVGADDLALFTDLYELTMLQAYWKSGMTGTATFSLYFRELPHARRFMLACGQQHAARLAAGMRFPRSALDRLAAVAGFEEAFLRWLEDFRFTGDIVAMAEGTPVFPNEPLLEVTAPIAEAQLLESLLMNLVHLETVLASKAARVVLAARGRPVMDFGMRRMHGTDAAVHGVRAFRVAGIGGTSNVLAGLHFGVPLQGTMAHSFIQAHGDESQAFREYARIHPGTTLLVDTYDTLAAVDKVIALCRESDEFDIRAIRIDSGDLAALARAARKRLDAAGLHDIRIVVSGGLDEYRIEELVKDGAPVDAFGVGTAMGTSADAPGVDLVYKLTLYDGEPRLKRSPGKAVLPGRKQVYRFRDPAGRIVRDEITLRDEQRNADALLAPAIVAGRAVDRAACGAADLDELPDGVRSLQRGDSGFEVRISEAVRSLEEQALRNN